jgi:hypothetical protein
MPAVVGHLYGIRQIVQPGAAFAHSPNSAGIVCTVKIFFSLSVAVSFIPGFIEPVHRVVVIVFDGAAGQNTTGYLV